MSYQSLTVHVDLTFLEIDGLRVHGRSSSRSRVRAYVVDRRGRGAAGQLVLPVEEVEASARHADVGRARAFKDGGAGRMGEVPGLPEDGHAGGVAVRGLEVIVALALERRSREAAGQEPGSGRF